MKEEINKIIEELIIKTKSDKIIWDTKRSDYEVTIRHIKLCLQIKDIFFSVFNFNLSIMNTANTVFYSVDISCFESIMLLWAILKQSYRIKNRDKMKKENDELPRMQEILETIKAI